MSTGKALPIDKHAAEIAENLVSWYREHHRPLPWREKPSLYRTVVSEFMCQQTQVATVLPYFERWMARFPDFAALARAPEEDVVAAWAGLGYYSRAKNLHKLAKQWCVASTKPQSVVEWKQYAGVGPYTAAAIASLAFGEASAVVDGNVVRVLARLTAHERIFAGNAEAVRAFQPIADSLIAAAPDAGEHNQAMMELGALVCRKAAPQCLLCPLRDICDGRKKGLAEELPRLQRKAATKRRVRRVWALREGKILLRKIPEGQRLAGMLELPEITETSGANLLATRQRGISNERITEEIFENTNISPNQADIWLSRHEIESAALSGPHKRWIQELWGRRS